MPLSGGAQFQPHTHYTVHIMLPQGKSASSTHSPNHTKTVKQPAAVQREPMELVMKMSPKRVGALVTAGALAQGERQGADGPQVTDACVARCVHA